MVTVMVVATVVVIWALAAGLGPGLLLALSLAAYNAWAAKRYGYGVKVSFEMGRAVKTFARALPSVGAPIIILTGMFSGIQQVDLSVSMMSQAMV